MLVLQLSKYMQVSVFHVEAFIWHIPSVSGILEQVLMEIAYPVSVSLINLAETLVGDYLFYTLSINLGIECKFYRVNDAFIELVKCYFVPI